MDIGKVVVFVLMGIMGTIVVVDAFQRLTFEVGLRRIILTAALLISIAVVLYYWIFLSQDKSVPHYLDPEDLYYRR